MSAEPEMTEHFADTELHLLRDELLRSGLDSWQAGELIGAFLSAKGYGVSNSDARTAATRIERVGCNLPVLREELQKLAQFM
ncbi:hypothetical protein [Granulicella rosea]|nr:hypothetical protein [Granulicella rosea]